MVRSTAADSKRRRYFLHHSAYFPLQSIFHFRNEQESIISDSQGPRGANKTSVLPDSHIINKNVFSRNSSIYRRRRTLFHDELLGDDESGPPP